jgi:hypothetical protein
LRARAAEAGLAAEKQIEFGAHFRGERRCSFGTIRPNRDSC